MSIWLGLTIIVLVFALLGLVIWAWAVKDYYAEIDDLSTREMLERYQNAPRDKQDLVKEILEDEHSL